MRFAIRAYFAGCSRLGRSSFRSALHGSDADAADRSREESQRAARHCAGGKPHGESQVGVAWIVVPFALMLSLSIAGIGSAWMGGSARIPFVAGLDAYMPSWLGRLHPTYATPYAALIVQGLVSLVLVVINFAAAGGVQAAFQTMLSIAVVLQLVPFIYMFAALLKLAFDARTRWQRTLQPGRPGSGGQQAA